MKVESISARAALTASAIALGVLIALLFVWVARSIFIVAMLGIILGLALSKPVDFLERHRVRRGLGAAVSLLLLVGIFAGIFALIAPAIRDQTRQLSDELPKTIDAIEVWVKKTPAKTLVQAQPKQGALRAQIGRELRNAVRFLFPIVSGTFGAIAGILIVLFIAMYIAAEPGLYREGLLHLVPHRHRERGEEYLATLRDTLRQWLIARFIAMLVIGTVTGTALALLKVKGAIALGVLAGLLEFVPFFGPFASAMPAIAIASLDSPQKALWVTLLYVAVQQLEGHVLTPLLLKKRLDIPPVLTLVSVSAMGVVFGVLGMLVAEPLLAIVLVTTKMLYVQDVVGDEVKVGKENDG